MMSFRVRRGDKGLGQALKGPVQMIYDAEITQLLFKTLGPSASLLEDRLGRALLFYLQNYPEYLSKFIGLDIKIPRTNSRKRRFWPG